MKLVYLSTIVALLAPSFYVASQIHNVIVQQTLLWILVAAALCFFLTHSTIPLAKQYTKKAGLKGKDLGKKGTERESEEIPEALGIVCGIVFLVFVILLQMVYARGTDQLSQYNAAALSICFMVLLGFCDDVVDLPWRYKLMLPTIASLPLLCSYTGVTSVVMPLPVRPLLANEEGLTMFGELLNLIVTVDRKAGGAIVDLGIFYFIYMGLLAVFCTNAINIYAGINGLEAGQSFVTGCAVLFTNVYELSRAPSDTSHPHLFAATLIIPFLAVTLALLCHNWYPADVFVGDTFCYFAGMTFAVAGILGHFSKTLLLFLIPQITNFLYSCPQLFRVYPCPRHRLPRFNAQDGLMYPSTFEHHGNTYANMTVINLMLRLLGPMKERSLTLVLLGFQGMCCGLGLVIRYHLSRYFYND